MVRRTQSRRGVVILIVLSLLVLFVLLVVTFAIVAGQYRRAAQAVGRREWLGEDPQKTADRVMYALVREPELSHTGSAFRGHALLTDVYGIPVNRLTIGRRGSQDDERSSVRQRHPVGWRTDRAVRFYSHRYYRYRLARDNQRFVERLLQRQRADVPRWPFAGQQHARRRLCRIRQPGRTEVRIMNPNNDGTAIQVPAVGNTFLLNGKPFVGTGFGFDSSATAGSPRLTDEALKPNRIGQAVYYPSNPTRTDTLVHFVNGGPNESYDAADYQNMIMAAVAYDPTRSSMRVLPSFHREELISYWRNLRPVRLRGTESWGTLDNPSNVPADWSCSGNPSYRQFRRKIVFRPMPWDHPNFTGSNRGIRRLDRVPRNKSTTL